MFKVIFYQKRIREKIQKYINMIDFGLRSIYQKNSLINLKKTLLFQTNF